MGGARPVNERLPPLSPDELDPQQWAIYKGIVGGRRAAGVQLFELIDDRAALTGPFNALLYAPDVGNALADIGEAVRYSTELSDRTREIAILVVAAHRESAFEWYAHERVGRHVGLTDDEIAAIGDRRIPQLTDPAEIAAHAFCREAIESRQLSDNSYEAAIAELGRRQVVELVVLLGYYETLALMLSVFRVGLPNGVSPERFGKEP
jgi:4-carboxymuconolactone decarboxylase